MTVKQLAQPTCPTAPAEPGHNFCEMCGGPIGTPQLAHDWSDPVLSEMVREGEIVESNYNELIGE